jgi:integrase-like protein
VPEANVDLALTVAEDLREKLVDDPCLVFREEELCDGRVRRLVERVQSHHLQAGAIDKERHALGSQIPMKSGLSSRTLSNLWRSASAYFRADTSRKILEMQQPKTLKARRTIPLGPHAIKLLKEHRDRSVRRADEDLIFPNYQGAPMRESKVLRRLLQPAAERAGLGRVTWHQFRHIHSSLLNDLRVPVKIAQEQLGHASISTTLNIYTHVVDASHRAAIEAVERQLFPSVRKSPEVDTREHPVSNCTVTS